MPPNSFSVDFLRFCLWVHNFLSNYVPGYASRLIILMVLFFVSYWSIRIFVEQHRAFYIISSHFFALFLFRYHVALTQFSVNLVCGIFSFWVNYSYMLDHMQLMDVHGQPIPLYMPLDPRYHRIWQIDAPFVAQKMVLYSEFYDHLTFEAPSLIDLIGLIELYEAENEDQYLERRLFYQQLDYMTVLVASSWLVDSGVVYPNHAFMRLIWRTLIDYKDLEWHSSEVLILNERLRELNYELIGLLLEYFNAEKLYYYFLMSKDLVQIDTVHSAFAQRTGLQPIDFFWGRFTPSGRAALGDLSWDYYRISPLRAGIEHEFSMMDFDIGIGFLIGEIKVNRSAYNAVFTSKLILEQRDMAIAGIKELPYSERVHYRSFIGEDVWLRYFQVISSKAKFSLQHWVDFYLHVRLDYDRRLEYTGSLLEEIQRKAEEYEMQNKKKIRDYYFRERS